MSCGEPGTDLDCATIAGSGLLEPFEVSEQVSKVNVQRRVVRLQAQCAPKRRLGGVQATQAAQRIAEIVVRFGEVRRELHGALAAGRRGSKIALFTQHAPEIVMRRCEIGVQIDRAPIAGAGLGRTPSRVVCVAEIRVSLSRTGGDRFPEQLDRALRPPLAKRNYAQQMQRINVTRFSTQGFTTERRSAVEPLRLIMRDRCSQLAREAPGAAIAGTPIPAVSVAHAGNLLDARKSGKADDCVSLDLS